MPIERPSEGLAAMPLENICYISNLLNVLQVLLYIQHVTNAVDSPVLVIASVLQSHWPFDVFVFSLWMCGGQVWHPPFPTFAVFFLYACIVVQSRCCVSYRTLKHCTHSVVPCGNVIWFHLNLVVNKGFPFSLILLVFNKRVLLIWPHLAPSLLLFLHVLRPLLWL